MRRTKSLESTAYHEAGHAVVARKFSLQTKRLSIVPEDGAVGVHEHEPSFTGFRPDVDVPPKVQRRIENMARVCLAGPAAL